MNHYLALLCYLGILQIIKQILQIEHKLLRIPSGGRLTSWLFTQHSGEVELGATDNKSKWRLGGGFKPGTSRFQIQLPKPLDHAASIMNGGAEERRSGGVEEWKNGGVEEWRNQGIKESRTVSLASNNHNICNHPEPTSRKLTSCRKMTSIATSCKYL